ncbi:MAG: potassium-transporting ATPase potassium-binding subunit [Solirubrobacterales bacterium]|jgi:K+-transporting ATPase ATPase A chain|nr:potassium-transporting ATPase potassium-binding subunit [Solirubrobacterales bacterium]
MLQGWVQIAVFVAVLVALVKPVGIYMARIFTGQRVFLSPVVGPIERLTYRVMRVRPDGGQDWKSYVRSLIVFSLLFWIALYLILRTQGIQPFNPQGFHSAPWDLNFNTTSSFITNTNWQYYGGETTLTYFAQMAGLAVQNFVSAAVGIAVVIALIRGIVARSGREIGNFWQDLIRTLFYILLPVSIVGALFLVSQGVIQNLSHYTVIHTLTGGTQTLAQGPVASQEVIKELGTNGGGFFNVNSAMPFENPSGLTNFFELLLILVIPAGLTYTYGRMVGSQRQGWAIFSAMFVLFLAGVAVVYLAEQHGTPAQHLAGLHTHAFDGSTGGNLEGKEQRFGIANSSLWTAVTTVTSCGAVNAAFESLSGLGGAVPFANLGFSEVILGGVGAGLYSMLLYVLLAVFIGGLMVGRTPEYLGKKIQAREIKLVSLGALFTPLAVLLSAGIASASTLGKRSLFAGVNPQGFSETLYAYLSQANNNGSAFAGYTGFIQPNPPGSVGSYGITFADLLGGVVMVGARFAPILFVLAVAGALAGKKASPAGLGTMRTDNLTFVFLLIGVVILVGALTFFPALLLGPAVQSLTTRLF